MLWGCVEKEYKRDFLNDIARVRSKMAPPSSSSTLIVRVRESEKIDFYSRFSYRNYGRDDKLSFFSLSRYFIISILAPRSPLIFTILIDYEVGIEIKRFVRARTEICRSPFSHTVYTHRYADYKFYSRVRIS